MLLRRRWVTGSVPVRCKLLTHQDITPRYPACMWFVTQTHTVVWDILVDVMSCLLRSVFLVFQMFDNVTMSKRICTSWAVLLLDIVMLALTEPWAHQSESSPWCPSPSGETSMKLPLTFNALVWVMTMWRTNLETWNLFLVTYIQ